MNRKWLNYIATYFTLDCISDNHYLSILSSHYIIYKKSAHHIMIRRPPQKFTSDFLKKSPLYVILWVRRQPPTRWVACWCLARKPPRQTCKVLGRFFYVRDYFLFWKMNVSNATIKIPKDIKSWKLKYTIDITSIPKNFGNATLQWFVSIQSATPLGTLSHGAHIPISSVLWTCFLDAPATRLS